MSGPVCTCLQRRVEDMNCFAYWTSGYPCILWVENSYETIQKKGLDVIDLCEIEKRETENSRKPRK